MGRVTPSSSGSSSVNTPQQVGLRGDAHFEDIAHASWWRMAALLPRTLAAATRLGWAADRSAMLWLAGCRLAVVASSAVALAALPGALAQLFQSGQVAERVAAAAPALLAEADPHTVWSKVGLVPQDYTSWPMDLRANIHLGQPRSESDALLLDAARAAGAESVVAHVPQGLDAAMLMLDKPTSAMDPRAEYLVIRRFKELAAGRTAVFVTQGLENARIADRIVVLDRGRVREEGDFQTLMARDGLFAELYRLAQDR